MQLVSLSIANLKEYSTTTDSCNPNTSLVDNNNKIFVLKTKQRKKLIFPYINFK